MKDTFLHLFSQVGAKNRRWGPGVGSNSLWETWLVYWKDLRALASFEEWQREPPSGLGQLWLRTQAGCLLNTHCPRARGFTLPSGRTRRLSDLSFASPLSLGQRSLQEPSSGLLRAGVLVFLVQCVLWVSAQRLSCLCWGEWWPSEFQVPLCSLVFPAFALYLQQWSGWAVFSYWRPPPDPNTSPVLRKLTKNQSLQLEPKRVVARGSWKCSREWESWAPRLLRLGTSLKKPPWQAGARKPSPGSGQEKVGGREDLRPQAGGLSCLECCHCLWPQGYVECLPFYIITHLHPSDNQELTLIYRKIVKTLLSLPPWSRVGGGVFLGGL